MNNIVCELHDIFFFQIEGNSQVTQNFGPVVYVYRNLTLTWPGAGSCLI